MVQAERRESLPAVHVEVTVPRMALPPPPTREPQPARIEDAQVRLLYEDIQGDGPQSITSTEVTSHASRRSLFQLFHLHPTPVRTRLALLQVLRPRRGRDSEPRARADELTLLLEVRDRNLARNTALTNIELTPGLHTVVVFLDGEGRPQGYSVDGTQQ